MDGLAVVIAAGLDARFVDVKVNGPPAAPKVIFCTATVAAFGLMALVMVQFIFAAATTLARGMVRIFPAREPKLAGLPVIAALASVHVAAVALKLVAGVSVMVTAVLKAVTFIAVGETGVAVLVDVVVTATGFEAKLVAVKVNGPPMAPDVIFCNDTVATLGVLVNMQAIASP